MNPDAPLSPHPPRHLADVRRRILTTAQLRAHGVSTAEANERCRSGGAWQRILPGVFLLHPGPPTGEERLHAVLTYASRATGPARPMPWVPAQPTPQAPHRPVYAEAAITGLAALALHGFTEAPPLLSLERIDVLVPKPRRLRSTGCARVLRTAGLPSGQLVDGVPVAPVPRALADAVAALDDGEAVRRLLTEAVACGHCEPGPVVRELERARLLGRTHVVEAVDSLVAEGRAIAEERLYRMVWEHGLPDPLWNVDLRLPGGPPLGGLDAYWPEQAVAVELDMRAGRPRYEEYAAYARKREHLERLGITVVLVTPGLLRSAPQQQAAVLRTALMAAGDREPAAYVVVRPR
ncbi:hypothetical protein [Streptomyces mangrovisoli]|nr:hypothetical protein [Streptomyces mangrovisoli]